MRYLSFLLFSMAAVWAAAPKFDNVLYGASYYHEYMPYERLEKDVELMKKAGASTSVRLGESTWAVGAAQRPVRVRMDGPRHRSPAQGRDQGDLGTTTYSIPPWLSHEHPEILVTRQGGQKATYGIRQNMDITSPTYRFYCRTCDPQIVDRYKNHPAIIGWQVDNETGGLRDRRAERSKGVRRPPAKRSSARPKG